MLRPSPSPAVPRAPRRHRLWHALLVLGVVAGVPGCATFGTPGARPTVVMTDRAPREIYAHGEKMMARGLYERAVEDFQELRNFHRDDPLSVRAQLALAEIRFKKGEFEEARYAYEEFATYHPRHPDMDFVVYRIGLCLWKRAPRLSGRDQSTTKAAVNTWVGFEDRFGESEYTEEVATLRQKGVDRLSAGDLFVARFYAKRKAWEAVRGRSAELVRRFPDSRHVEEALARYAAAAHRVGRTIEAEAARDRLVALHPDSRWLPSVVKVLEEPPGSPPEDEVFVRPYRMPGMTQLPPGGR